MQLQELDIAFKKISKHINLIEHLDFQQTYLSLVSELIKFSNWGSNFS